MNPASYTRTPLFANSQFVPAPIGESNQFMTTTHTPREFEVSQMNVEEFSVMVDDFSSEKFQDLQKENFDLKMRLANVVSTTAASRELTLKLDASRAEAADLRKQLADREEELHSLNKLIEDERRVAKEKERAQSLVASEIEALAAARDNVAQLNRQLHDASRQLEAANKRASEAEAKLASLSAAPAAPRPADSAPAAAGAADLIASLESQLKLASSRAEKAEKDVATLRPAVEEKIQTIQGLRGNLERVVSMCERRVATIEHEQAKMYADKAAALERDLRKELARSGGGDRLAADLLSERHGLLLSCIMHLDGVLQPSAGGKQVRPPIHN